MAQKFCKHCKEYFETENKYASSCPQCKEKNYRNKMMNNLFGGEVLFVTIKE